MQPNLIDKVETNIPFVMKQQLCEIKKGDERLIFVFRDQNDYDCLDYAKQLIKEIRQAIPTVKIYAINEEEKKQMSADEIYDATKKLACAIVFGGNGTLLNFVSLFQELESPPIWGIAKGSSSILYNFCMKNVKEVAGSLIEQLKKGEMITETCERLEIKVNQVFD